MAKKRTLAVFRIPKGMYDNIVANKEKIARVLAKNFEVDVPAQNMTRILSEVVSAAWKKVSEQYTSLPAEQVDSAYSEIVEQASDKYMQFVRASPYASIRKWKAVKVRVKRSILDALSGVVQNILSKYYPEKYARILRLKHKKGKNSVEYGLATLFALLCVANPDIFDKQLSDRKDTNQIRRRNITTDRPHDNTTHSIIIRITVYIDINTNPE